jgi:hypothetical protein
METPRAFSKEPLPSAIALSTKPTLPSRLSQPGGSGLSSWPRKTAPFSSTMTKRKSDPTTFIDINETSSQFFNIAVTSMSPAKKPFAKQRNHSAKRRIDEIGLQPRKAKINFPGLQLVSGLACRKITQ